MREFEAAGRTVVGSAPVGHDGTAAWLEAIGAACGVARRQVDAAQEPAAAGASAARSRSMPIKGRITLSGYEGSELLVARLLVESGADLRYVGTACPRTKWSEPDREWLEAHGVHVQYRASLEQDLAAIEEFKPDLAIGTTPVVQKAKQKATPALYFTNLISARPLMGPAGAGSLAQVVNAALGQPGPLRRDEGVLRRCRRGRRRRRLGRRQQWPRDRPEFRAHYRRSSRRPAKKRKAEEMI